MKCHLISPKKSENSYVLLCLLEMLTFGPHFWLVGYFTFGATTYYVLRIGWMCTAWVSIFQHMLCMAPYAAADTVPYSTYIRIYVAV